MPCPKGVSDSECLGKGNPEKCDYFENNKCYYIEETEAG